VNEFWLHGYVLLPLVPGALNPLHPMTEPLRPADVFISYSREDAVLCAALRTVLEGELKLSVFVDTDIPSGLAWEAELRTQLAAQNKPAVVLLATNAAVKKPDEIRKEIALARQEGLLIVPICVELNAAVALLPDRSINELQLDGRSISDERVVTVLRRALLTPRLGRAMRRRSAAMEAWLTQHAQANSFWAAALPKFESVFRKDNGLALIGPGGGGKSTLAALLVNALCGRPWTSLDDSGAGRTEPVRAILLGESDLLDGGQSLAKELGANSAADLQEFLAACRLACPFRLVFVVDGLDQMAPDRGSSFSEYALALQQLSRAAPTLVTCRPEVWEQAYKQHDFMPSRAVDQLEQEAIAAALAPIPGAAQMPSFGILRRPLFLDIALRFGSTWPEWPHEEMGLLHRLWQSLVKQVKDPHSRRDLQLGRVLGALAALQVEHARFDIPLDELKTHLGGSFDEELEWLKCVRMLRTVTDQAKEAVVRVRFTHDVLDAFSMVHHLANMPADQRQEFFANLSRDGIWSVLSMLAAYGVWLGKNELREQLFLHFVKVLDRKYWGPAFMDEAWFVTYALQERLEIFLPLILKVFETDTLVPQLAMNSTEPGSSLVPPVLTQEAGSTLASAFQALHAGRPEDAALVLPRLIGKLETWGLRVRIIEAIAKYAVPEARQALLSFLESNLPVRNATEIAPIVRALDELKAFSHPSVELLLDRLANDASQPPKIRRQAAHSLEGLTKILLPIPPRDDAEMIEDLSAYDLDKHGQPTRRPSDWRVVKSAADEIGQRIRQGHQPTPQIAKALASAMDHKHTEVRCFVAEVLAELHSPMAVLALVKELAERDVTRSVRAACVAALRKQLTAHSGHERQAIRCLLFRAAQAAEIQDRDIPALAFRSLLAGVSEDDTWPCDEFAALLTPLTGARQGFVLTLDWVERSIDAEIDALVTKAERVAAGAEEEPKFRFSALVVSDQRLQVQASPSSWGFARAFHVLAHKAPHRLDSAVREQYALPPPLGRLELPGLAVVHCIVSTSDGQVLMAQRNAKTAYSPGRWSVSFEEQATIKPDGRAEHPFETARRGFIEEFGLDVPEQRVHILGAIMEIEILNIAVVVHLRCAATAAEILHSWVTEPRPKDHHEAKALKFMSLEALRAGIGLPPVLHPSSAMRLKLLHAAHAKS